MHFTTEKLNEINSHIGKYNNTIEDVKFNLHKLNAYLLDTKFIDKKIYDILEIFISLRQSNHIRFYYTNKSFNVPYKTLYIHIIIKFYIGGDLNINIPSHTFFNMFLP